MNRELLEQVKARILAEPEHFRMDTWSCGTAHCIGGWALLLSGIPIRTDSYPQLADGRSVYHAASDVLGVDRLLQIDENGTTQADRLFLRTCWPEPFSSRYFTAEATSPVEDRAKIAAERIDHFIATEGKE